MRVNRGRPRANRGPPKDLCSGQAFKRLVSRRGREERRKRGLGVLVLVAHSLEKRQDGMTHQTPDTAPAGLGARGVHTRAHTPCLVVSSPSLLDARSSLQKVWCVWGSARDAVTKVTERSFMSSVCVSSTATRLCRRCARRCNTCPTYTLHRYPSHALKLPQRL